MAIGGESFQQDLEGNISVGDPTRKSHHDALAGNTDFLRNGCLVNHDFDPDTGDGYHNGAYDNNVFVLKDGGNTQYASLWLNFTGDQPELRVLFSDGSAPTVNAVTDGQSLVSGETSSSDFPF